LSSNSPKSISDASVWGRDSIGERAVECKLGTGRTLATLGRYGSLPRTPGNPADTTTGRAEPTTGKGKPAAMVTGRLWSLAGTAGRFSPMSGKSISPKPIAVFVAGSATPPTTGRSAWSLEMPGLCRPLLAVGKSAAGDGRSRSNEIPGRRAAAGLAAGRSTCGDGRSMSKSVNEGASAWVSSIHGAGGFAGVGGFPATGRRTTVGSADCSVVTAGRSMIASNSSNAGVAPAGGWGCRVGRGGPPSVGFAAGRFAKGSSPRPAPEKSTGGCRGGGRSGGK
jgi:hypothetical protein